MIRLLVDDALRKRVMKRFSEEGVDRNRATLFHARSDGYVSDDNPLLRDRCDEHVT